MRQSNIDMFQDTMSILQRGFYQVGDRTVRLKLSREQMEAAEVFLPGDIRRIVQSKDFEHVHVVGRCGYGCENEDAFSVARKRMEQFSYDLRKEGAKPVLVLNLAIRAVLGGWSRRAIWTGLRGGRRRSSFGRTTRRTGTSRIGTGGLLSLMILSISMWSST